MPSRSLPLLHSLETTGWLIWVCRLSFSSSPLLLFELGFRSPDLNALFSPSLLLCGLSNRCQLLVLSKEDSFRWHFSPLLPPLRATSTWITQVTRTPITNTIAVARATFNCSQLDQPFILRPVSCRVTGNEAIGHLEMPDSSESGIENRLPSSLLFRLLFSDANGMKLKPGKESHRLKRWFWPGRFNTKRRWRLYRLRRRRRRRRQAARLTSLLWSQVTQCRALLQDSWLEMR